MDRYYVRPIRLMPKDEWKAYLNHMLFMKGFDRTRLITVKGTAFDRIFSQEHLGA
jgi:hypothetical protein